MHMGALAVLGANHPENMVHIIINNGAHETVGGMLLQRRKLILQLLQKPAVIHMQ